MAARGRETAILLYRSILQAHKRHLPLEMRQLGNSYVKAEFKLHKSAKQEQVGQFFSAWEQYLNHILQSARVKESFSTGSLDSNPDTGFGKNLPPDLDMSEEQRKQLENLKDEASRSGKLE
jgi:hypothetical protein